MSVFHQGDALGGGDHPLGIDISQMFTESCSIPGQLVGADCFRDGIFTQQTLEKRRLC